MSLNRKDFIISGKNPITDMVSDGDVIAFFEFLGYKSGYISFVAEDNFKTSRGIKYPSNKTKIELAYGKTPVKNVVLLSDRLYLSGLKQNIDVSGITNAKMYLDYSFNNYGMRFYFDKNEEMVFLAYYKNYKDIPIQ